MKRHPALVPLSRDHHHALVIARRLRQATAADAADSTRAFLVHWEEEEQAHFRLEEEILLPAYAARGDVGHPAIARALLDHVMVRRDVLRLAEAPPLEVVHELGARLAAHVEFEEHELFPLIERTLSEPDLAALGERLRRAGSSHDRRAERH
jgi:hemerythrin-like domain-containing protein